jgi:hypothetical protein
MTYMILEVSQILLKKILINLFSGAIISIEIIWTPFGVKNKCVLFAVFKLSMRH